MAESRSSIIDDVSGSQGEMGALVALPKEVKKMPAAQRYLEADEKREVKLRFIRLLDQIDLGTWEDVHGQRQESEISR